MSPVAGRVQQRDSWLALGLAPIELWRQVGANLVELVDSTGTTRYAWDGIRVLKLEDEEGALKQRQVHPSTPLGASGYSASPQVKEGPVDYVLSRF